MSEITDIFDHCTNRLPGHGPRRPMKELFQGLADALQGDEFLDNYGSGAAINDFAWAAYSPSGASFR